MPALLQTKRSNSYAVAAASRVDTALSALTKLVDCNVGTDMSGNVTSVITNDTTPKTNIYLCALADLLETALARAKALLPNTPA